VQGKGKEGKARQSKAGQSLDLRNVIQTPVKPTAMSSSIYFERMKRKFSVSSILLCQLTKLAVCIVLIIIIRSLESSEHRLGTDEMFQFELNNSIENNINFGIFMFMIVFMFVFYYD
jgi:hypothetical protein